MMPSAVPELMGEGFGLCGALPVEIDPGGGDGAALRHQLAADRHAHGPGNHAMLPAPVTLVATASDPNNNLSRWISWLTVSKSAKPPHALQLRVEQRAGRPARGLRGRNR